MSSIPGYTLECFLMWLWDIRVEDQPEANFSVGIAESLDLVVKRPVMDRDDFQYIVSLYEPYRDMIEDRLSNFDEETQSWRGYGSYVDDDVPETITTQVEILMNELKTTGQTTRSFIDTIDVNKVWEWEIGDEDKLDQITGMVHIDADVLKSLLSTSDNIDPDVLTIAQFGNVATYKAALYAIDRCNHIMDLYNTGHHIYDGDEFFEPVYRLDIREGVPSLVRQHSPNTSVIIFGDTLDDDEKVWLTKEEIHEYFQSHSSLKKKHMVSIV